MEDFPHVLLACHHELMIDHAVGIAIKQRGAWMNVNLLIISDRLVPFLWILPTGMIEEASSDGFPDGLLLLFDL